VTFASDEVRDAYHKLPAETQVCFRKFVTDLARVSLFIEVTEVTGSEMLIRITREAKVLTFPRNGLDS